MQAQPLASAGYLLAEHSQARAADSPRPALPPRALHMDTAGREEVEGGMYGEG